MTVMINPTPTVEPTTLLSEIRAATRSCHTALNRLITTRLPLCLPPHATNPAIYARGIATFGCIYVSFEHAWDEALVGNANSLQSYDALKQLRIPALSRSARLRADLALVKQRLDGRGSPCTEEPSELCVLSNGIRRAILQRPHLILAYTWVYYMALFNGGRWIRDQLNQSGPGFWGPGTCVQTSKIDCLSFWEFEGLWDGEDIKEDFQARFSTAAAVMNEAERQDIVGEAVRIFETCTRIVGWLDEQTQPCIPESTAVAEVQSWLAASCATASSTICSIWAGVTRAMPFPSLQRSEFRLDAGHHAP